jgi:hypothetical protein
MPFFFFIKTSAFSAAVRINHTPDSWLISMPYGNFFPPENKKTGKNLPLFFALSTARKRKFPPICFSVKNYFFGMIFAYLFGIPKSKIRRCANEYFSMRKTGAGYNRN